MDRAGPRPWRLDDVRAVLRIALIFGGVAVLALVAWHLVTVALLFFGAVVVATVLRSLAEVIERVLPISTRWSLVLACIAILCLIAGFVILLGAQLSGQISNLIQQIPQQISWLEDQLGVSNLQERLVDQAEAFAGRGSVLQSIAGYTSGLLGGLTTILLVLVGGIYLAARPDFYFTGSLRLLPPSIRDNVASTAENAGRALRLWLAGQLVAMLLVGILITAGLYLIGMPSPLALGLLAALTEFVPIVGPVVGAIPALLLAFAQGSDTVLWVIALYVVVQQLESNLIMPLVQRRTVDLPPVLTLFALLAFGVLFGPVGVLLSAPLTVVLFVAVKQLYLRDTLQERTEIPGQGVAAVSEEASVNTFRTRK